MAEPALLYLVATPIGNLADMSTRAVDTLRSVELIAAEDTRHSYHLLQHYAITTPVISLHQHNEQQASERVLRMLLAGKSVALISDAGTPLVSDPGLRLVSLAHEQSIKVVSVPGACAAICALVSSGLSSHRFAFEGFLPPKGERRRQRLIALQEESRTMIFYESVHRIQNLMTLLVEVMGPDRLATLARELTKRFETVTRGKLQCLQAALLAGQIPTKGEFVVLVAGHRGFENEDAQTKRLKEVLDILLAEVPVKLAVKLAIKLTGCRRQLVYDSALAISKKYKEN